MVAKTIKKLDLYVYTFARWVSIKDIFDKYMAIWEKVSNVVKKYLIKNILKLKKDSVQKKA